ncbi:FAD:protein FMN transferase [Sulfitobacter sp. JB4-11]|uniref:FAD:protein FMN transferase n=1 Tax=Sulfitobacter rhodophyticola TaxID=3238304 RepID=UPI003D8140C2
MRFVLMMGLLMLAACKEELADAPDPVSLTAENVAHYCMMNISEHPGPKAQIFLSGLPEPIFFAQVRDAFTYIASAEQEGYIAAVYVNDMALAPWDTPGADNWMLAGDAHFVVGSGKAAWHGCAGTGTVFGSGEGAGFCRPARWHIVPHGYHPRRGLSGPGRAGVPAGGKRMTQTGFSRRRFLQITAAAPIMGMSLPAQAAAPVARWQGVALGAASQIILLGLSEGEAATVFAHVRAEIARLEGIFSLYQPQSALSRLNVAGRLDRPAPELLEVLSLSQGVWQASQGAFDPTVQPLWRARAMGEVEAAPVGDFADLRFTADRVVMKPGMALTLNGIAQGYITDRVAALLRAEGLRDLVVDAGEQRALGERPGGGAWRMGVADPGGRLLTELSLRDRALATSSPRGTVLPGGQGHILDARTGEAAQMWQTVSVTHDAAAVADALSTAACCLSVAESAAMLAQFGGAEIVYRG